MAYDHSMKLKPNATAFFNLELRYDDMGNEEAAVRSLKKFYELAGSENEKDEAEASWRAAEKPIS